MDNLYVIKRNPLLSVWFILLGSVLWCKIFLGINLLEEMTILIVSILVALFLLTVPLLYLTQKIVVGKDIFKYRTLFSKKEIAYDNIHSISFQVSKQHDMNDNNIKRFHSVVFQLRDSKELRIPYHFFVGKDRGTLLINQAISVKRDIILDKEIEKIKDSIPINSIIMSRTLLFIFANLAIFFAISIIP